MLKAACIQHCCTNDTQHNLQKIINQVRLAAAQGTQLVLLQELHNSVYFCTHEDPAQFDLAETIPGPSTDTLTQLAAQLKLVIVCSLFEKRTAGIYHNTAVVIDSDGSIAGRYRKMHIPDDPGYYEKFYFTPGDLGFKPIDTSIGKLGVLVCWDQWFPEAARLMALNGAELLLYPTAIGWYPTDDDAEKQRQLEAWITIQRSHAVANGIPVMSCNRTGFEPDPTGHSEGVQFWGNSFICGPQGEFIARANDTEETILIADIDLQHSEDVRRIWPYLRDRRIDAYDELLKRFVD